MLLLDANAILRFILQDNNKMADKVEAVLAENNCIVTLEVLAEIVYVLQKVYQLSRKKIAEKIREITNLNLVFESEVVLYSADLFSSTKLDFVDCLLAGYSKVIGHDVFTFDKELNKHLA